VIVALVVTPHLFQTLGEEAYGLVNLSLTIVMLFGILVTYGFHLNGPKQLALLRDDPEGTEKLINEIVQTRLILSFLLCALVWILIQFFDLFVEYQMILILSLVILFNEAVFPFFVLQGYDRLSWISKSNAVSKIIYLVLILFIVSSPNDAPLVNFIFGASALIINILLLVYIYKAENLRIYVVSFSRLVFRLRDNFQFFISTIAGHISIHGGLVILGWFVTNFELGQYSLAQRIVFLLRLVPIFIFQSILQKSSVLFNNDREQFESFLKKASWVGMISTFALGLGVLIFSKFIIRILSGEYVMYSTEILRILAFLPFLSSLNISNIIRILITDRKDVMALATWITSIFMLVSATLSCYYYGGHGLSVALLATEMVSFIAHSTLVRLKITF
jgi:O-antigen/teichoic acid export membrane protein